MVGFVIAAGLLAVVAAFLWLIAKAADGSVLAGTAAVGIVILGMGTLINMANKVDENKPCHQYETKMMYNAATKTMMPSRACVLRGEWVEEDHDNQ